MRGRPKVSLEKCVALLIITILVLPVAMAQSSGSVPGGGAVLTPTGEGYDSNTCYNCHSDSAKVKDTSAADQWKDSVHYKNDIGCERCHSASVPAGRLARFDAFGGSYRDDHIDLTLESGADYKAPSAFPIEGEAGEYSLAVRGGLSKQQSIAMCARCHGLTPLTPESPKNVFPDYLSSVHGQSVVVGGLGDPARVGKSEVDFEVTGEAGISGLHRLPQSTCNQNPKTTQPLKLIKIMLSRSAPARTAMQAVRWTEKFGIVNAVDTYQKTHHGRAAQFGVEGVPNCIDCHVASSGSHKILSKTNPQSDVHPDNVAKICANEDCHNVEFNVGSGSMHGKDRSNTIGNLINLFYWILIPSVVGFFALYIVLDFTLLMGKKGGK